MAVLICAMPAAASWRTRFLSPSEGGGAAAVAVDGAGDVVAAGGRLSPTDAGAVAKYDGADGAEVWHRLLSGTNPDSNYLEDVALESNGDAVVVGTFSNVGTNTDLAVVKLAAADGAEIWRTVVHSGYDNGTAVAVDAGGDVVAGGGFWIGNTTRDVVVLKLAGATGVETWRWVLSAAPNDTNHVFDVAVDGAGDVIAVGTFQNALGAVKLDGTTGAQIWRASLDAYSEPTAVVLGGTGDVFVPAFLSVGTAGDDFGVLRLSGTTGAELWRYSTRGEGWAFAVNGARSLALDAAGDVVAAGEIVNHATYQDIAVVKLAGATGSEVWRTVISGSTDPYSYEQAASVAVDGAGDVVAGVALGNRRSEPPAVLKLSGSTGAERWRQVSGGTEVTLFAGGDIAAAGSSHVMRVSGLDGGIGTVAGRTLQVRDRTGDTTAELLVGLAVDPAISMPPPGSAGDPALGGATVRLVNPLTLESATLAIPGGAGWTAIGNPPGSKGWRYRDLTGAGGPCKSALARPGKLKALCQGTQGPIPFSLDEPSQGTLVFSLQLGSAAPQCATFGGTIRRDQGAGAPGETGYFLAAEAPPAPGGCP